MSSQPTKAALNSLDKAEFLVMSTRTQNPRVSAELTQTFRETPAGGSGEGTPVPWDVVQESHAVLLEQASHEVRRTGQVHRLNRAQAKQLRRRRRKKIDSLRDWHRGLQKQVEGTYGEDSLGLVGLDAPSASRYVAVREQSLDVVERMRKPDLPSRLPEPLPGREPLDLETLANALEAEIRELEAVMEAIKQMRKIMDESLIAKQKALKDHRRVLVNVGRIQEGYYRLVGLDELADRIRAASPRRRPASPEPDKMPEPPPPPSSQEETP